jgi:hypothetical protein
MIIIPNKEQQKHAGLKNNKQYKQKDRQCHFGKAIFFQVLKNLWDDL